MTHTNQNNALMPLKPAEQVIPVGGHQYPLPAISEPPAVPPPESKNQGGGDNIGTSHSPPTFTQPAPGGSGDGIGTDPVADSSTPPDKPPAYYSASIFDYSVPKDKPDYNLPRDFYGLPYGPYGLDHDASGTDARIWDNAYTYWVCREATPAEKSFCNRRDDYIGKAIGLLNTARLRKHPSMPTLGAIDYFKIPRNMDDIKALWDTLNDAEKEYLGWLQSVPEYDPQYPSKTDCFSPAEGKYYRKTDGGYLKLIFTQYQEQLAAEGYDMGGRNKITREGEVSKIVRCVTQRQVTVVTTLSGMDDGFHHLGRAAGEYLALRGPIFPEEVVGEAPTIMRFLRELTASHLDQGEQYGKLMDWLADAYRCRKAVNRRQHRALLLAGPKNTGKGVFTKMLLANLLGGRERATNAAKYILGKTEFNGEWAKADLLYVDDAVGDGRMSTKIQTADAIKSVVAGDGIQSIHPKGLPAMDMPVWWRLVICLNDTEEVLGTLPPLIDGFDDKFIMIQCHATMLGGDGDKTPIIEAMKSEMGQFAQILSSREVRDVDGRGPKSWIAPSLRDKLLESSPETELLDLLIRLRDNGLFNDRGALVKLSECTRDKLHHLLARNGPGVYTNLCRTARNLGVYLRRMEQHGWITSKVKDGSPVFCWKDTSR